MLTETSWNLSTWSKNRHDLKIVPSHQSWASLRTVFLPPETSQNTPRSLIFKVLWWGSIGDFCSHPPIYPELILKLRLTSRIEGRDVHPNSWMPPFILNIHKFTTISHWSSEKMLHGLLSHMLNQNIRTRSAWYCIFIGFWGCRNFLRRFTNSLTTATPKHPISHTIHETFLRWWQIDFGHTHPFRARHTKSPISRWPYNWNATIATMIGMSKATLAWSSEMYI